MENNKTHNINNSLLIKVLHRFFHQFNLKAFKDDNSYTSKEFYELLDNKDDMKKIERAIETLKSTDQKSKKVKLSTGVVKEFSISK